MQSALATYPPHPAPIHTKGKELGEEITEMCAYIYAATYQLLVMIQEFDEKKFWALPGLCSCAHWLNFKCGIGMHAAREKVRVANALKDLPKISEAFRKGQLSYSKVRAMTRIADNTNEDYLLMIARHGTAYHVEKLVSQYRRCKHQQEIANANKQYEKRELKCYYDYEGNFTIKGRMPAEQGAMIIKAIELAVERSRKSEVGDSAAANGSFHEDRNKSHLGESLPNRRADALAEIAEAYLNAKSSTASSADRYQVIVHVSSDTLIETPDVPAETPADESAVGACPAGDQMTKPRARTTSTDNSHSQDVPAETSNAHTDNISHLENGPHVPAETSRRIACDCSKIRITDDKNSEPLSIGRKSRTISPAIRRALRTRDKGCRFPGCTNSHYVDGHHIKHWADGGETSLDNLVQLCRHHHRLVHEGGFGCERLNNGKFIFRDPTGNLLIEPWQLTSPPDAEEPITWIDSLMPDVIIDSKTCVSLWTGERIDWNLAVGHLFV